MNEVVLTLTTLKFVTLKTVFLITLATGRRRSEIHAIWFQGVSSSIIDGNLVYTLPVLADFWPRIYLTHKVLMLLRSF